jgi:hypothetical protein
MIAPLFCSSRALVVVVDLDPLLAYALRANSRRGEGVVGFRREQPFAGLTSVLVQRQVLHGAENYGLVKTGIRMLVRNQRYGLASIGKRYHSILLVAIATGGLQPGQNCALDSRKRTSKTPQPSQNLSSRTLTTSEERSDSPQQYWVFQFDFWLMGSP